MLLESTQLSNKRWDRWARLLTLLVAAFLIAVAAAVYYSRRCGQEIRVQAFRPSSSGDMSGNKIYRRNTIDSPDHQQMTLDPTGKYLQNYKTGKPVFITGDAAWSVQVQLSDEDIQLYLADRASRGFNAILVDLVDNYYCDRPPHDFYGNVPFNGPDFTNENPVYWARVDQTLSWAAAKGITIIADPAFVGYGCTGGYCQSYRNSSIEVVRKYGEFLGKRYESLSNIIWIVGGDADPADNDVQSKLNALASGIRSADTVHLITTENYRGASSIDVWSEAGWLDLNALYSEPQDIPAKANNDYLTSAKPAFMFEDWYEGEHGVTGTSSRREGYWAVLSGCTLGRIFGNYAIWGFGWPVNTTDPWKKQLDSEGSVGQAWLGKLFRSREHWMLVPDINHTVMTGGYSHRFTPARVKKLLKDLLCRRLFRAEDTLSVAARTSDGQTVIVYVPNGDATTISVDLSKIVDPQFRAKAWWFNPRDGSTKLVGTYSTTSTINFISPDAKDWVLVIDSLAANLSAPATADL